MTQTNSVRVNDPTSVADVPVRRASIQKSKSEDRTTADATFEREISDAKRASDVQKGAARVGRVTEKTAKSESDTGTREKDSASAADDATVETDVPAVASDNPLGSAWAAQVSQNMLSLQIHGDAATPIKTLQEKSTTALAAARDLLLQRDIAIDDAVDQPAANETSIVVNANETHWLFGSPVSPDNHVRQVTAGAGSAESMLASILGGDAVKTTKAGETGDTPEKSGSKIATSATQKSAQTLPPVGDVRPSQDQASGGSSGDRPAARDQTFKPAEKISSLSNAGVQVAESISSNTEAPQTPGAMVVQQLRTRIVDAMRTEPPATPQSSAPAFAPDRPLGTGQVLRTIDLTLEPPDLGAVKLRLSLKSNALTIDAEASKASTAKLLNDDRDTLEKSLRTSGYDVSAIRVTDASSTSGTMLGSGSSFQDGSQARSAYAGREPGNFQQRSGDNGQQQDRRSHGEQRENRPSHSEQTASRPANAVYI